MSDHLPKDFRLSVLAVGLLLGGCSMSADEVISVTKKCEAAGMDSRVMESVMTGRITEVQCTPRTRKDSQ